MGIIRRIESFLERIGDRDLKPSLDRAVKQVNSLLTERVGLQDRIDVMSKQLNELRERLEGEGSGPTLYLDEVQALECAVKGCDYGTIRTIRDLIKRCDHSPMTVAQVTQMIHEAIAGLGTEDESESIFQGEF